MNQQEKAELLRSLHAGPEVLVLPNVWDGLSARIVEAEGFPVVATSSAGVAYVLGYPDGQVIPRQEMLFLIGKIAQAVEIPVTADIEAGYDDPVRTTLELIEAGVVGMNLEDAVNHEPLPLAKQLETIRAVRGAFESAGIPVVLNARTDLFLIRHGDPETRFARAVERLNAYHDAGADCLFAPGVVDNETIGRLVVALKGPLNVLATVGSLTVAEMKRLGVRRLSTGSGPSRIAAGSMRRFLRTLREEGSMRAIDSETIPYAEVQKLLSRS